MRLVTLSLFAGLTACLAAAADAATIAPPMLDITQQCEAGHRGATAMSECVVAESEARAEILQRWNGYSDASAEKCIKASRKAKHLPYSAMARCLSTEAAVVIPPSPSASAGDARKGGGLLPRLGCFFSSSKCSKSGS